MEKILDIVVVREKKSKGVKSNYRIVLSELVLERLGLSHAKYIAFRKKSLIEDVQLINIRPAASTKKIYGFMGLAKIGPRGRICLPKSVVASFNLADGDYLKLVELKKSDIRLRKVHVEHHYVPKIHPP